MSQRAVIYCRVSSKKQRISGDGLSSQETRCRNHAKIKGYGVARVFPDDVSGGGDFMNRPGMVSLLRFLDDHPDESFVVVFDDLKRFARDTIFHIKLRSELSARGASVECLNFNFDDTPEGEFVETIIAAQSQLERQQNRRQTIQKMKARVEKGYCVKNVPPIGYTYRRTPEHGNLLVRDEPLATIIQEALEGFASGRFGTQSEVKRFLEAQPQIPKAFPNGEIRFQMVTNMLKQVNYAGMVQMLSWGMAPRRGKHAGLISLQTFEKIQARLNGGAIAPARKDCSVDFPLRGFVLCGDCCKPLTAGFSRSKTGRRYPYYMCHNKKCASHRKSIPQAKIEGEFAALLKQWQPTTELVRVAGMMFKNLWEHQHDSAASHNEALRQESKAVDRQIEQLLDRVVEATSQSVTARFEQRIAELERKKSLIAERLELGIQPRRPYREMFELALRFLASPCKLWASGRYDVQRLVLKLAFSERLPYCRQNGFRTPKMALPFNMLDGFERGNFAMARPGRFELPTS